MVIIETISVSAGIKTVGVALAGSATRALWRAWSQHIGTYLVNSYTINYRSEFTNAVRQRLVFSPCNGFRAGIVSNHAHVHEADMRCQATTTLTKFIDHYNEVNLRNREFIPVHRYDVSTSTREAKFNVDGDRLVYGDSDLGLPMRYDRLEEYHVVTMIDVDYYLEDFSRFANNPIMISTAMPTSISGRYKGSTFRYTGPDTYEETVAGGAKYVSGLWDYSPDLVRINTKTWGIQTGFVIMKVEKLAQPETANRYLVSLIPKVRSYLPYWLHRIVVWISGMSYEYGSVEELSRVSNVMSVDEYLVGRFAQTFTKEDGKRCVTETVQIRNASSNAPDSIIVPEELFQALCVQAKTSKNYMLGDTSRIVDENMGNSKLSSAKKTLLHDCVVKLVGAKANVFKKRINYQIVPEGSVRTYDRMNKWKPTSKHVAQSLLHNDDLAVSPCRSHMNDTAGVHGRVDLVKNDVVPSAQFHDYALEFVTIVASMAGGNPVRYRMFLGDKRRVFNHLHPVHISVVDAHQNLPNQKVRREREQRHAGTPKQKLKVFPKMENYAKASDQRGITTVTTSHTRNLSCFAYAASDHIKKYFGPTGYQGTWMLPGCKPVEIADGVFGFVRTHDGKVIETDYSRFDGTISLFLRQNVEFATLRKMFAKCYRRELDRLLAGEINQNATTMHGVKYNTGGSRLSGSPLTTLGNTLINAYIAYCGLRMSGRSPKVAMRMIGPKYGDDGIDYDCDSIREAAEACGLKMKIIKPDSPGKVGFLGRVYPDAVHYNYSHFDVMRALKKIPVVVNGGVPPEVGLARKVAGYLAADPTTPILSNYCRALQRIYNIDPAQEFKVASSEERYLQVMRSPWPCATGVMNCDATDSAIAKQFNLTVDEMVRLDDALSRVNTESELALLQFDRPFSEVITDPNVIFHDESPEGGRE